MTIIYQQGYISCIPHPNNITSIDLILLEKYESDIAPHRSRKRELTILGPYFFDIISNRNMPLRLPRMELAEYRRNVGTAFIFR